jgi:osmoprotectant transport system substrate-binding protein
MRQGPLPQHFNREEIRPMRLHRVGAVGASLAALVMFTASCGSGGGSSSAKGVSVTIGSANFSENIMLAHLYAGVLKKAGFTVSVKEGIGAREVIAPALASGSIDLVPEYAGNLLAYVDPNTQQGLPLNQTITKLKAALAPKNLTVLAASQATDGDILVANAQTASKYNLHKISDLAAIGNQLVLGGPPECATRITCQAGLASIYGIHFKDFKALDAGGPLTVAALVNNDIQIGRMFSADSTIKAKGFVVLQDDKSFQLAGNVIPEVRTAKVSSALTSALNKLSSTLTTQDLIMLDDEVQTQKMDPTVVADNYLKSKGLE